MANKKLNATLTIGGAISGTLRAAFGSVKSGVAEIGSEIRKLTREQKLLSNAIDTFGRQGKNVDGLRSKYAAVTAEIEKQRRAQERLKASEEARGKFSTARGKVGGALATGAVVGGAIYFPIKEAIKFETAMLGIAKQVNEAKDANGNLTAVYFEMGEAIQKMGREIPIATNEIADMVTGAARMGIAKDDLLEFTRTAATMATAFEMPAAELADNMGKIAGIFKIPIKQVAELGDAINYLDDNAISKGADIIKVMQGDLAGAASVMGLSAKNAAALASTFLTLGESAERADTAASGMLRQLQIAKMNPKRFQIGVQMIGMTADELQKGMIKAPQETILKVLDAINKLPQEKQMEAVTRLFGKDWGGAIAKLAGGVEEYRRQIELANGDAAKGSMGREMQQRMRTTAAQMAIFKNRITEVGVAIGTALLPALNSVMEFLSPVITGFALFAKNHPKITAGIVGITVAAVSLGIVFAGIGFVVAGLGVVFASTVGLVVAGVVTAAVAVGAAALAIYSYWEPIKGFFADLWEGVKNKFAAVYDWIVGKIASILEFVGKVGSAVKTMFSNGGNAAGEVQYDAMGNPTGVTTPDAPPMAAGRVAAPITDNSKYEFNITTQPGQDEKAIADAVMRRLKEKEGVKDRSRMYDGAGS